MEIDESPVVDLEEWHDAEAAAMLWSMAGDDEMASDDESADGNVAASYDPASELPQGLAESMQQMNALLVD